MCLTSSGMCVFGFQTRSFKTSCDLSRACVTFEDTFNLCQHTRNSITSTSSLASGGACAHTGRPTPRRDGCPTASHPSSVLQAFFAPQTLATLRCPNPQEATPTHKHRRWVLGAGQTELAAHVRLLALVIVLAKLAISTYKCDPCERKSDRSSALRGSELVSQIRRCDVGVCD